MSNPIATTILEQLGGHRFIAMTGAKNLMSDKNSLTFKLPARRAKDGINCVKVALTPADTYTVTFYRQAPAPTFKVTVVSEHEDVYSDNLRTIFESATGLYTSL